MFAVSNKCSHLNLPLVGKTAFFQGEVQNKCIICPAHKTAFDLATGAQRPPVAWTAGRAARSNASRRPAGPRPGWRGRMAKECAGAWWCGRVLLASQPTS